jgi:hypothetical protein
MRSLMIVAAGAALSLAGAASAQNILDIDLTGFIAAVDYDLPGNTELFIPMPIGAEIISAEFIDLMYVSHGDTWNQDFVLSINDGTEIISYWDAIPYGAGSDGGVYGPESAHFDDWDTIGGPFTITTGVLYVNTYNLYGFDPADYHEVLGGTLRITWVPAPTAVATFGLAGLVAARRRRG